MNCAMNQLDHQPSLRADNSQYTDNMKRQSNSNENEIETLEFEYTCDTDTDTNNASHVIDKDEKQSSLEELHRTQSSGDAIFVRNKIEPWRDTMRAVRMMGPKCVVIHLSLPSLYEAVFLDGKAYLMNSGRDLAKQKLPAFLDTIFTELHENFINIIVFHSDVVVDETSHNLGDVLSFLDQRGIDRKSYERFIDGPKLGELKIYDKDGLLHWKACFTPSTIDISNLYENPKKIIEKLIEEIPSCANLRINSKYLLSSLRNSSDNSILSIKKLNEFYRIHGKYEAGGVWNIEKEGEVVVWSDASKIGTGVVIQVDGNRVEDFCWLSREDGDKNELELRAALKGITLGMKYAKSFQLMIDNQNVHDLLEKVFSGNRVEDHDEMFLSWTDVSLASLKVMTEYIPGLCVRVKKVKSTENLADPLTNVAKTLLKISDVEGSVKLSPFDPDNSESWLKEIDSVMAKNGITEQTKIIQEVRNVLPNHYHQIVDNLLKASPLDCYDQFKDCLRSQLKLTSAERFEKLMSLPHCSIDWKPSKLFNDLKLLYPLDSDHEIIKEAFVMSLPKHMKSLCRKQLTNLPLSKVAELADEHLNPPIDTSVSPL